MSQRVRAWIGLAIACLAAIGWAINLAFLQRLAEPAKPWDSVPDLYGGYAWARDLRIAAIVAIVAGVVLATSGRWWPAIVGGPALLVADVWFDRIDVAGPGAAAAIAAVMCLLVLASRLLHRRPPSTSQLLLVAGAAAAVSIAQIIVREPQPGARGLMRFAVLLGLVVVALVAALASRPTVQDGSSPIDGRPVVARRPVVVGAILAVVGGLVVVERSTSGLVTMAGLAIFAALLFTAVAAASRDGGSRAGYVLTGVVTAVLYPTLLVVGTFVQGFLVPYTTRLTALAGNPRTYDGDYSYTLAALPVGLLFGAILAWSTPKPAPLPANPQPARLAERTPSSA